MRIIRLFGLSVALAAAVGTVLTVPAPAGAITAGTGRNCGAAATTGESCLVVSRHHPDARVPFVAQRSGEALIDLTAAAPGTDWVTSGADSAVVSILVDHRYETDLVVTGGQPLHRQLALG